MVLFLSEIFSAWPLHTTHRPSQSPPIEPRVPKIMLPVTPPIAVPTPGIIAVPIAAPAVAPAFEPTALKIQLPPMLAIEDQVFLSSFLSALCNWGSIVLHSSIISNASPATNKTVPPIRTFLATPPKFFNNL